MREAPAKAALQPEFEGKGLQLVGVALREDRESVRDFAERTAIRFPLLIDRTGTSPGLFGLWGHPNTVVIDRRGRVVALVRGERDWKSEPAVQLVRRLLDVPNGVNR